jgi:hypothetical protein
MVVCVVAQWRNGLRHGRGRLAYGKGHVYDGDWMDDERIGVCKMVDADKYATYVGDVHKGVRHGYGEQLYSDGSVYRGYWEDNDRSGYGVVEYCDGHSDRIVTYEGEVSGRGTSVDGPLSLLGVLFGACGLAPCRCECYCGVHCGGCDAAVVSGQAAGLRWRCDGGRLYLRGRVAGTVSCTAGVPCALHAC